MTNFPTTLDVFQNPGASTTMDAPGFEHDKQHANLNDAVAALEAKVGVNGSTVANSLDYQVEQLAAMLLQPNATVKFVISGGQVLLTIWDTVRQQYYPLTLNNGQLGVGQIS
ncbi:MAG: hypothetical protein KGL39_50680 [Patescibacteria group bacterium]|nr:hypothetical protein [Patescibacteria group bacterium]